MSAMVAFEADELEAEVGFELALEAAEFFGSCAEPEIEELDTVFGLA